MKKQKIKRLILIMMCLLILLVIILVHLLKSNGQQNSLEEKRVDDDYYGPGVPIYIEENTRELYPENIFAMIYRYKGEGDISEIHRSLYNFKDFVEALSKENLLTEEDIQEYYNQNLTYIEMNTGVWDNYESFERLFKETKKLDLSKDVFQKASIDIKSIEEKEDRITCELSLEYTSAVLQFQFSLMNNEMMDAFVYEGI